MTINDARFTLLAFVVVLHDEAETLTSMLTLSGEGALKRQCRSDLKDILERKAAIEVVLAELEKRAAVPA